MTELPEPTRACDADRERALTRLHRAVGAGGLGLDEFAPMPRVHADLGLGRPKLGH